MTWELVYTRQAQKDVKNYQLRVLMIKKEKLLAIIQEDPFQNPVLVEKLMGDLSGACSRRINIQHRNVYQVYEQEKIAKIIRLWTQYE